MLGTKQRLGRAVKGGGSQTVLFGIVFIFVSLLVLITDLLGKGKYPF